MPVREVNVITGKETIRERTPEEEAAYAAGRAREQVEKAEEIERRARRVIPNEPNGNKPVTWDDMNKLLDALKDQGIIL